VERETAPGKPAVALGCKIWIEDGVGIQVTSANKNEESILKHGKITFTTFPSWDSPLRRSIKVGMVKGDKVYDTYVLPTSRNMNSLYWLWNCLSKDTHGNG